MYSFTIIATGYNCASYVKPCYDSILSQTNSDWKCVLVSDGSTDNTADVLNKLSQQSKNFAICIYQDNRGAAYRRYEAIKRFVNFKDDIVILMGLDDMLLPNAVERIKEEYVKGKLMTYGCWKNQHGILCTVDIDFDEETHKNRSYRKVKWRSTAPLSFKRYLFDKIPEKDFQIKGEWLKSATESELGFSLLEMCGKDRIGVIKEPIYIYNERRKGGSLDRLGVKYKYNIYDQICARKPKDLYE